jgi:hypothetical protein
MQRTLTSIIQWAACLLLLAGVSAQAEDKKVNPVGTWTWTRTGQNGQTMTTTMKLKMEGDKLTGTVSGRQNDTAIDEAKLKGDEITFTVTREFNGNKMVSKYKGKIDGDKIVGNITTERNGETGEPRDWEAKREVEKEKEKAK